MLILKLLLHPEICNADIMLEKFKYINIYKDSPKLWNAYIRIFLDKCLNVWNNNTLMKYNEALAQIYKYGYLFEKLKTKVQNAKLKTVFHNGMEHMLISASGQILLNSSDDDLLKKKTVYRFMTHPSLSINFTINVFYCGPLCCIEFFDDSHLVTLTGYWTHISIYPRQNNLSIVIQYDRSVRQGVFLLQSTFTAMDKDIISLVPHNTEGKHLGVSPGGLIQFCRYNILNKFALLWYLLQVRKFDQVVIRTTQLLENEYIIYDGPGIFIETLRTQPVQICSTFQCLLHLMIKYPFKVHTNFISFDSQSLLFSETKQVNKHQTISTSLPNINCFGKICAYFISAQPAYQVNATLLNITTFNTDNILLDHECKFSGLAAAEASNIDYRTFCHNYDSTKNLSASFYSKKSSLRLVLYWYKEYSKINVTIGISQTECQTRHIDNCHRHAPKRNCFCHRACGIQQKPIRLSTARPLKYHHSSEKCSVLILFRVKSFEMCSFDHVKLIMKQVKHIKGFAIMNLRNKPAFLMNGLVFDHVLNSQRTTLLNTSYSTESVLTFWKLNCYNAVFIKNLQFEDLNIIPSFFWGWLEIYYTNAINVSFNLLDISYQFHLHEFLDGTGTQLPREKVPNVVFLFKITGYVGHHGVFKQFPLRLTFWGGNDLCFCLFFLS